MRSGRSLPVLESATQAVAMDVYQRLQGPGGDVERGLGMLSMEGPQGLSAQTLREELKWLANVQHKLEALTTRWVAELDRRLEDQAPGRSCANFLEESLGRLWPGPDSPLSRGAAADHPCVRPRRCQRRPRERHLSRHRTAPLQASVL